MDDHQKLQFPLPMRSYIVIPSPSYGGVEKRFFDIFTALTRCGEDVYLVAPSSLIERYRADHQDRQDALAKLISVDIGPWSPLAFIREMRQLLRQLPSGANYHYPLNCLWPLHIGRGDRVSMSAVDCTRIPRLLSLKRTNIWDWLSFFFSAHIDVLSPNVFASLQSHLLAKRMSLTPGGTFLVPAPQAVCDKAPSLVLMGRLFPGKGIDDFLDVLPALWSKLRNVVPSNFSVEVAGYGQLQQHVESRIEQLKQSGIPIKFLGYADAEPLFAKSSVVLSMQEVTNYPSRVVAEAMMLGCGVIVRDTGDSRQFGTDIPGLFYCERILDAQELAEKILFLLERIHSGSTFSLKIREAALNRFCSVEYIEYFRKVIIGQATKSQVTLLS